MKKRIAAIIILAVLVLSLCSCGAKKVDFSYFYGNFSPFFARSVQDLSAAALTQESLLVTELSDDGTIDHVYDAYSRGLGIADIDIDYTGDRAVCTVKLGQDIYFSDGVQLTSKDVAFSLYVYAQADYDGWSSLKDSQIDGLAAYRYGTAAAGSLNIESAKISAELEKPSERTKELIRSRIIYPVLREEYKWMTHLFGDKSYIGTEFEEEMKKYPDPRSLFAFYYAVDTGYDAQAAPDVETFIGDIADQYDADYKTLGLIYGNDLGGIAQECARQAIIERTLEGMDRGERVTSIRGIEIVDDFTLKITINSVSGSYIEDVLGIYVAPFHYYGTGCTFDGQGFTIDLDSVAQKSAEPLGAGRYVFKSYKSGKGVKYIKNKNYYRGLELENSLYFKETGSSNAVTESDYLVSVDNRMLAQK